MSSIHEKTIITTCGECPGATGGGSTLHCEFEDHSLDVMFLINQAPPQWCPLRTGSFVLETILQPFGE